MSLNFTTKRMTKVMLQGRITFVHIVNCIVLLQDETIAWKN